MPVGLLKNGFGMAPDSAHTLPIEVDIHRQEHNKQPRSLLKSHVFMQKGRMRAGLSFIFSMMPNFFKTLERKFEKLHKTG